MENTEETIAGIKTILSQCRSESQGILSDPIVRQWSNIDIGPHAAFLADLGINRQEVASAVNGYRKAVGDTLQQVTRLENELSNLEADLRLNSLADNEAQRMTRKLQTAAGELQVPLARIRQCKEILVAAAKDIQEKFSLRNLLQIASSDAARSAREREMFEKGYMVFKLVTQANNGKEDFLSIHDISAKTERIEAKFRQLELPAIPELAKAILNCQIDTCYEAFQEIHHFLAFINCSLKGEITQIDIINEDIRSLRAKPFAIILESLTKEGEKLGRNISEFQYKANFIKEIENIEQLLENLQTLYESLRYSYFPHLGVAIKAKGFHLSPQVIAAEIGSGYFRGLRGIIRSIKLALSTTDSSQRLDKEILSQKIFIALSSCPYYYCGNSEDAARLPAFIDGLISKFSKPYPYEDLYRLINEAITTYGCLMEKDFAQFKAEKRPDPAEDNSPSPPNSAEVLLGRLLNKIAAGSARLRSLQNHK
ncbi:MAG: hypothetical protein M0P70_18385 [Desulfobulbaceae bacterium]|nr:hypothetical protein [Desulfobulbaceae bacterium]